MGNSHSRRIVRRDDMAASSAATSANIPKKENGIRSISSPVEQTIRPSRPPLRRSSGTSIPLRTDGSNTSALLNSDGKGIASQNKTSSEEKGSGVGAVPERVEQKSRPSRPILRRSDDSTTANSDREAISSQYTTSSPPVSQIPKRPSLGRSPRRTGADSRTYYQSPPKFVYAPSPGQQVIKSSPLALYCYTASSLDVSSVEEVEEEGK